VDLTPELSRGGLITDQLGFVGNFKLNCPQGQYSNGLAVELNCVGISTDLFKLFVDPGHNVPKVCANSMRVSVVNYTVESGLHASCPSS